MKLNPNIVLALLATKPEDLVVVMSSIILFRPISILSTEFRHIISLSTSSLHASWVTLGKSFVSQCKQDLKKNYLYINHICMCKQDFKKLLNITLSIFTDDY